MNDIWKYIAAAFITTTLVLGAYHWRDWRFERVIAQRNELAEQLAGAFEKDQRPEVVSKVNAILKTNGRPDLQREVPQKQVAQKGTDDARAEAPDQ